MATIHDGGRGSAHWMLGRDSDQAELGNFTLERQPDVEAVTSRKRWGPLGEEGWSASGSPIWEPQGQRCQRALLRGGSRARPAPEAGALAGSSLLGTRHQTFLSPCSDSMLTKHLLAVWLCKRLSPGTQPSQAHKWCGPLGTQSAHRQSVP